MEVIIGSFRSEHAHEIEYECEFGIPTETVTLPESSFIAVAYQ